MRSRLILALGLGILGVFLIQMSAGLSYWVDMNDEQPACMEKRTSYTLSGITFMHQKFVPEMCPGVSNNTALKNKEEYKTIIERLQEFERRSQKNLEEFRKKFDECKADQIEACEECKRNEDKAKACEECKRDENRYCEERKDCEDKARVCEETCKGVEDKVRACDETCKRDGTRPCNDECKGDEDKTISCDETCKLVQTEARACDKEREKELHNNIAGLNSNIESVFKETMKDLEHLGASKNCTKAVVCIGRASYNNARCMYRRCYLDPYDFDICERFSEEDLPSEFFASDRRARRSKSVKSLNKRQGEKNDIGKDDIGKDDNKEYSEVLNGKPDFTEYWQTLDPYQDCVAMHLDLLTANK